MMSGHVNDAGLAKIDNQMVTQLMTEMKNFSKGSSAEKTWRGERWIVKC